MKMKTIDFLITTDETGGTMRLTNSFPENHCDSLILRVDADDLRGDFWPADDLARSFDPALLIAKGKPDFSLTAAGVVYCWAVLHPGRTTEELAAASRFLRQWPEGPQITGLLDGMHTIYGLKGE